MMQNDDKPWIEAIDFVLKMEGGRDSFDPNDHGGQTSFGISKASYPNEDIENMTKERAIMIYERDFWKAIKCDQLPAPLSIAVFDAAVNQGDGAAKRMLQIVLGVAVDGVIGDETIRAAFKADPQKVLRDYLAQRMGRYIRTVMKDSSQETYIENWSRRLMSLSQLVFNWNY